MPTPLAVPADITDSWVGGGQPDDDVLLATLIANAEVIVRAEYPDIDTRIGTVTTAETVAFVITRMVTRHFRNPEGTRTEQNTEGPFSRSRTYGGDDPGALQLTDDDRKLLGDRRAGQRAFTIRPGARTTSWLRS